MLPILYSGFLPVGHHVLHTTEILRLEFLLELLTRQPLEIRIAKWVTLQVSLAGHDAALEEERLLAGCGDGAVLAYYGVDDDVGDWDSADDPCVHVDSGGLVEDSFRSLHELAPTQCHLGSVKLTT